MKLSFNSWAFGAYPSWLPLRTLDDVIDLLAETGYDGIEIGGSAPHAFPDYLDRDRRDEIAKRLARRRLEVSALIPAIGGAPGYNPASPDAVERQAFDRYVRQLIELAHDWSCGTVIHLAGYRRTGQSFANAFECTRESLRAAAEYGAPLGVRFVVEPIATTSNVIERTDDAIRLIREAGIDAGVMLDTLHILNRGDDITDALREAGSQLEYLHVSDSDRRAPGTYRDFTTFVRGLRELRYDGWLSVEIGLEHREYDPDDMVRQAFVHLRGLLDRIPAATAGVSEEVGS